MSSFDCTARAWHDIDDLALNAQEAATSVGNSWPVAV
jgi:hypothetical protein